jgi:Flp pilus assembly protein TadB
VAGAIAVSLATFSLLYGIFGIRRGLGISDRELVRISTLSPLEFRAYREGRRSAYARWLRPLLVVWGHKLRLRPIRVDRLFLAQAGVDPERFDGLELRALKLGGGLLAAAGIFMLGLAAPTFLVLLPIAAWCGYVGPTWYLSARRRGRQDQIRRELPDLVGVLRSFIAAGVPLERALHLISTQAADSAFEPNLLGTEVKVALGRYGLGATIEQALDDLSQRVGVDEVSLFVSAVTQGRRLGSGMDQLLRDQEVLVRMAQRNRATAEASRVSTKLMGILAAVYLPEFVVLIMIPLFWGIIRRAFG